MRRFVEIRQESDGNAVEGVAMRYGAIGRGGGGMMERFEPRAIQVSDNAILTLQHDRKQPVARSGAGLEFDHDDERLAFRAAYPDTEYGRRARELVGAGILRGVSIEFAPLSERMESGIRVIERAAMPRLSLVDVPAYPSSVIEARAEDDAEYPSGLELRSAGGIAGYVALGVAGIVSLSQARKVLIEPDADIRFDETGVYLLDGFSYERALATTAAGSLAIQRTKDALLFNTIARRMVNTDVSKAAAQKIRGGLLRGAVAGIGAVEGDSYTDDDGFTVQRIRKGMLCHVNLVARAGDGYSGGLARSRSGARRAARRRWL